MFFGKYWYNGRGFFNKEILDRFLMRIKFLLYLFVGGFLLWFAGCETVPVAPGASRDLKVLCEQYNVQWYLDNVSQVINLRAAGREAKALIDSNVVIVEREKVYLMDNLRRDGGTVIVPEDFLSKVILRLVGTGALGRQGYHIVVDAGHGGKDPGARSRNGTQEKDITLDISRRLKQSLESRGFKVTMTRDRDVFISLEQRTEIATHAKADLFVSIHANSSPSRSVDGIEVYALRDLDGVEKRDPQRQKNQRMFTRSLAMKSGDVNLEMIIADMLYNYKIAESQLLAAFVNKGTSVGARVNSRGVKRAGFHVLRNTLIPAVLVEVGFLTNSQEEAMLRQADYRQKLADGVAASLVSFSSR